MPRQARVVVPDIAMHVRQRGHNGNDCFRHETDYLVYLTLLRDVLPASRCLLHAYCLMTNHTHLLLTPCSEQACALLMRNLGQRYVQYFNRRYRRRGTLWQGRFESCLVDSASYLLACHRYVERNPVRAGMVPLPSSYPWSSYQGNAGRAVNKLLTPHAEYLALGTAEGSRHAAYQAFVAEPDEPAFLAAVRDATDGGFGLVGEALRSRLPADVQRRLARRPPGPRPASASEQLQQADIWEEIGLRPGIR